MFSRLLHRKVYFYSFFLVVWLVVQFASKGLLLTLSAECQTLDAHSYVEGAKSLIQGEYPWFRAVGYPLLISPFIYLFGENGTTITFLIIHLILWLLSLRLIFNTLLHWDVGRKTSFWGSVLYSICISPLLSTNHLLTETSYIFLLLLSLFMLSKWLTNKHYKYTGLIFIVLVVSALIRPSGLYFYYASTLILLVSLLRKNLKVIPFFVLSALTLLVHIGMMKKHHNTTQACLSKNHAIYHYLYREVLDYPEFNPTKSEESFYVASALLDDSLADKPFFYAHRDSIYLSRFKPYFASHRYATFKTMWLNFKDEINTGYPHNTCLKPWVYFISRVQHILILFSIPLCFILWVIYALYTRLNDPLLIWLFICGSIIAFICLGSSIVFWYGDRIHLPFYPLVFYILIIGLQRLYAKMRFKSQSQELNSNSNFEK